MTLEARRTDAVRVEAAARAASPRLASLPPSRAMESADGVLGGEKATLAGEKA